MVVLSLHRLREFAGEGEEKREDVLADLNGVDAGGARQHEIRLGSLRVAQ